MNYYQSKKIPPKRDLRAEDRARTGHPDLGKVVLYQMSYFRITNCQSSTNQLLAAKELRGCKNRSLLLSKKLFTKFFYFLLVLRRVQSALLNGHILLVVTLRIQLVTTAKRKRNNTCHAQIKYKSRRRYPVMSKVTILDFL